MPKFIVAFVLIFTIHFSALASNTNPTTDGQSKEKKETTTKNKDIAKAETATIETVAASNHSKVIQQKIRAKIAANKAKVNKPSAATRLVKLPCDSL